MRRYRYAKIVATLGPASNTAETIAALFTAGADVFRLNFSHGDHAVHATSHQIIRHLETQIDRPIGIMMDLQGPKLRVGTFEAGQVILEKGQEFRLDLDPTPGTAHRVNLPHPELYPALSPDSILLLDDGKIRLKVVRCGVDFIDAIVINGGTLSNRKGLNVPSVMLPISSLTDKDRRDLDYGLSLGVDWVALSFVQRPEDILEARSIIGSRAKIIAKLEKPLAIEHLDQIIELADGILVARGDLGVELPPEEVPSIQKRIIRKSRQAGKPVLVATQMLDSMVNNPTPTRAEASDVATAIYEGVDAVMLSAESASGNYPVESVTMMNRIIHSVENDPTHREMMEATEPYPEPTTADAITLAAGQIALTIKVTTMVTFTDSGFSSLRAARSRPSVPILSPTPNLLTARYLSLVWGVHSVVNDNVRSFSDMVNTGCRLALDQQFASMGDQIIVVAGVPFGVSGGTNILRVARIQESPENS